MVSIGRGILARGPWQSDQVEARWLPDTFEPPAEVQAEADAAVAGLRERGSPAHDGMATRLAGWREEDERLLLDLQPVRWALRLVEGDACDSLTALCVVRDPDGRWLAGRRGGLGFDLGGALGARRRRRGRPRREPGRHALARAARGVAARARAAQRRGAARLPNNVAMVVGLATCRDGAEPGADHEHDEWAWWPADVDGGRTPTPQADGRMLAEARAAGPAAEREPARKATPIGQLTPVPPSPQ